jgi:hypothetical protein
MVLSEHNYHAFMYNVVYKKMLRDHFGVPIFILHLKILSTKILQQRVGIT